MKITTNPNHPEAPNPTTTTYQIHTTTHNHTLETTTHNDAFIAQTYLQQFGVAPPETYKITPPKNRVQNTENELTYTTSKWDIWQQLNGIDRMVLGCTTKKTAETLATYITLDNPNNQPTIHNSKTKKADYLQ